MPLTPSDKVLWNRIYAALEGHRLPTDADAQAALDRIAAKVLRLPGRRSFNPSTCSVRKEPLSVEALRALEVYHRRASPQLDHETIVVLQCGERRVVVDGNNRVNRWLATGSFQQGSAIIITPHDKQHSGAD